jgi:hypothetical protein
MSTQPTSRRRPRFVRSADTPSVQLTDRDLRIFSHLARFRLLTREQVQRLEFSPSGLTASKRRLGQLFHAGFLGRIALPLGNAYGASQAVYFLDRLGAKVLEEAVGVSPVHRGPRDADREKLFLRHALDISDVAVSFVLSCRLRRLELVWWPEARIRRSRHHDNAGHALLPDAYLAVGIGQVFDGFALEVDRATVAESRMRARFRAYGQFAASGNYLRLFPYRSFRVLVIVTADGIGPKRLARLRQWCEDEGGGSLFWFTNREGLLSSDVLSEPIWQLPGRRGDLLSLPLT